MDSFTTVKLDKDTSIYLCGTCSGSQFRSKTNDSMYECVDECPNNQSFVSDNVCIASCSYYYEDGKNKFCVDECGGERPYVQNDTDKNKCVSACLDSQYVQEKKAGGKTQLACVS